MRMADEGLKFGPNDDMRQADPIEIKTTDGFRLVDLFLADPREPKNIVQDQSQYQEAKANVRDIARRRPDELKRLATMNYDEAKAHAASVLAGIDEEDRLAAESTEKAA